MPILKLEDIEPAPKCVPYSIEFYLADDRDSVIITIIDNEDKRNEMCVAVRLKEFIGVSACMEALSTLKNR